MSLKDPKPPILLLQWLDPDEIKEAAGPFRSFRKEVLIQYVESTTRAEALAAIRQWLRDNSNAQFLYIGSHGNDRALGANPREYITWSELGNLLRKTQKPVVLWLGACDSRFAAAQWKRRKQKSALWVVGFQGKVLPTQLKRALSRLLRMTRIDNIIGADQELPLLRKILPRTLVTMQYPICEKGYRTYRYVDVDRFPGELGFTLTQYLDNPRKFGCGANLARRKRSKRKHSH